MNIRGKNERRLKLANKRRASERGRMPRQGWRANRAGGVP